MNVLGQPRNQLSLWIHTEMPAILPPKPLNLCYPELIGERGGIVSIMLLAVQNLTSITSFASAEPEELPKTCCPCFATGGKRTSATSAIREPEGLRKTCCAELQPVAEHILMRLRLCKGNRKTVAFVI